MRDDELTPALVVNRDAIERLLALMHRLNLDAHDPVLISSSGHPGRLSLTRTWDVGDSE